MEKKSWIGKALVIFSISVTVLGGFAVFQYYKFFDGKLHLVFCNVGQGDAIYIRTPKGHDILIDGGPDKSILSCLSNNMPFWDRQLDLVILTHPHLDHFKGLEFVLKRYSALHFYTVLAKGDDTGNLNSILKKNKIEEKFIAKGDEIKIKDGVSFKILWPEKFKTLASDPNFSSLVLEVSLGSFNALLTADTPLELVIPGNDNLYGFLTVLKVPHHGSKTGLDKSSVVKIKPKLAVISVAKKNQYHLPAPQTLEILRDLDIKILRTDENGEIQVSTDGKGLEVRSGK